VEIALLAPWIFFLFVGIFDFGFYAYAIISTENAARAAAIQTSAGVGTQTASIACDAVWAELKGLPNVSGLAEDCTKLPVIVTQQTLCTQATVLPATITCNTTGCADCGGTSDPNGRAASSKVTVQYQTMPLIPIPGILLNTSQTNITRIVEMRIISE